MLESKIEAIIRQGEGLQIEFKQCETALNKDVYETVCAFLNRAGGELLLGVRDDGAITGIASEFISQIKNDFTTAVNNPQKINPSFYLSIDEVIIEDKSILYIYIPESSQVHRCNGKIYDRNEDGDFDITNNTNLVAGMYMRKQGEYTENRIFPFAEISELKAELLVKARKMAVNERADHPWKSMNDLELLKSAGLYLKDHQSGKEGITLGGILIFGNEQLIQSALPHYRTDAILRRVNLDCYDDRDDIRVNLLESYERLMHFVSKHLNDNFYLEGDRRISLRDKIFREVVSNLLIHREFANPFPAKLIIEKDRVFIENSNRPHFNGIIDPENFSPFPKNPSIAKFFKEIGLVDELGSGVRNIYKYSKIYSGAEPTFIEGDVFKTIIPLTAQVTAQATAQVTAQATAQVTAQATAQENEEIERLLKYCEIPKSRSEMQEFMNLNHREYFRKSILTPLIKGGLLKLTMPDTPTSPNQKYYSE